jgi:hypothetical protein
LIGGLTGKPKRRPVWAWAEDVARDPYFLSWAKEDEQKKIAVY